MKTDFETTDEEEYQLPCTEALLAGTLALMTGHAQACCDNTRQAMTAKIVGNLSQLSEHPVLTPLFRAALGSLLTHWQAMQGQPPAQAAPSDPRLWHASPSLFQ